MVVPTLQSICAVELNENLVSSVPTPIRSEMFEFDPIHRFTRAIDNDLEAISLDDGIPIIYFYSPEGDTLRLTWCIIGNRPLGFLSVKVDCTQQSTYINPVSKTWTVDKDLLIAWLKSLDERLWEFETHGFTYKLKLPRN